MQRNVRMLEAPKRFFQLLKSFAHSKYLLSSHPQGAQGQRDLYINQL